MKYIRFRIRNFKGIKDTTVSLEGIAGASVFAFVGLNESGKTTILEAIHTFSPDGATGELVGGSVKAGVPFEERVPRHQLSSFTGSVSVVATISMSQEEKDQIIASMWNLHKVIVDPETLPLVIDMERSQSFKDGDFVGDFFSIGSHISVKTKGQRKWRGITLEEHVKLRTIIFQKTPDICYFPTFVFDFPERIFLTDRGNKLDRFYRRVFQDILDYDGQGFTIEKDIVRRVRTEELTSPWLNFLAAWTKHSDAAKIQHVIDRASSTVTKVVFGRWNKIFGEDAKGKEIFITSDVAEGEIRDAKGAAVKTQEHDVFIKFQIRDGTRRFNVNDRSLGFRWFFAFMLFTQFRVARTASRPILFLFDEPASNLHAAAQQKLIDCFPEIARGNHALIYTTHSHYMIEPKWLEQTFIVTNRADAPPDSVLDAVSLDDESLDVQATSYRSFVNDHPSQTNYFQPILDRLEVVPSRLDIKKSSVILEGRSDYYILRYASKMIGRTDLPLMPGLGAGTFGALAALHVGWNLDFLFVLDSDAQGLEEKNRYVSDFGIPLSDIATIADFLPGIKIIEDIVDDEAKRIISASLGSSKAPTKPQIKRFFQERLASEEIIDLGKGFAKSAGTILDGLSAKINSDKKSSKAA
ncbi:ATP-dependent nuclease [Methylobacterium radiotolerans]|uniref:ATP-dependent nuclease n=1 Tax=Methylobacterium radiotolerans TaxID=31998 RepID=UPI0015F73348|nr:AAA family ATPase [Methylobacterium radiotolerans]